MATPASRRRRKQILDTKEQASGSRQILDSFGDVPITAVFCVDTGEALASAIPHRYASRMAKRCGLRTSLQHPCASKASVQRRSLLRTTNHENREEPGQ